MVITARYPGTCARTGAPIRPGDSIQSVGRKRYALVDPPVDPPVDPELAAADPDAAAVAGRYLRQSMARGVSHIWNSGGKEYYRNKAGRCEDAPCCGCCNA